MLFTTSLTKCRKDLLDAWVDFLERSGVDQSERMTPFGIMWARMNPLSPVITPRPPNKPPVRYQGVYCVSLFKFKVFSSLLLFDDNKMEIARKPGKIYKENPVEYTGEGKKWKGNIRKGLREGKMGTVLELNLETRCFSNKSNFA